MRGVLDDHALAKAGGPVTPRPVIPDHLKRESEIQAEVVAYFRRVGLWVYATSEPRAKKSSRGVWDCYLICERSGRVAWWDTKQPGQPLTQPQRDFMQRQIRSDVLFGFGQMAEAITLAVRLGATRKAAA